MDERPEEVTDFKMQIGKQAEIVASSNDNPYRRHIEVTEQVLAHQPLIPSQFEGICSLSGYCQLHRFA